MAFKLGSEKRKYVSSLKFGRTAPVDPIVNQVNMPDGTIAEASMDGTINIDKDVPVNSALYKRAIKHEKKHIEQIKSGKAAYDNEFIHWKDEKHKRVIVNGETGVIIDGEFFPDGHPDLEWEKEAIQAEKN